MSALTSHRREKIIYQLLDDNEDLIGTLDGVTGGSLSWSIFQAVKSSGDITYTKTGEIDWSAVRIKITYSANGLDFPLGVYLPAITTWEHTDATVTLPIDLYDKLLIPQEATLGRTLVIKAGSNIMQTVVAQIKALGENKINLPTDSKKVSTDLVFEPADTILKVVNTLLESAGYLSLYCDPNGWYRAEPAIAASSRPIQHTFMPGDNCIHLPEFKLIRDWPAVPYRLTCVGRTNGDEPADSASYTLDDVAPGSEAAAKARRWKHRVDTDVEAATLEDLQAICKRRLLLAAAVTRQTTVKHAYIPLALNQRVRFSDGGQDFSGTITQQRMSLDTPGALVETTIREVSA